MRYICVLENLELKEKFINEFIDNYKDFYLKVNS